MPLSQQSKNEAAHEHKSKTLQHKVHLSGVQYNHPAIDLSNIPQYFTRAHKNAQQNRNTSRNKNHPYQYNSKNSSQDYHGHHHHREDVNQYNHGRRYQYHPNKVTWNRRDNSMY